MPVSSKNPRGRSKKTAAYRYRCMAYYYAIELEVKKVLGFKPTPADLNRFFGGDEDSKNWYSYRAGESMPGRGSYKSREIGLQNRIDTEFPEAAKWRDHMLWSVIDCVELTERDVHRTIYLLPVYVSCLVMSVYRQGMVSRNFGNPLHEISSLVECNSLDALVAVVALLREGELRGELDRYQAAQSGMHKLLPLLDSHAVLAPFASELKLYISSTFNHMWHAVPGCYEKGFD